jgi:hypothetical protein
MRPSVSGVCFAIVARRYLACDLVFGGKFGKYHWNSGKYSHPRMYNKYFKFCDYAKWNKLANYFAAHLTEKFDLFVFARRLCMSETSTIVPDK